MKVAIVGTRRRDTYDDYLAVESIFEYCCNGGALEDVQIVSGGCREGGDRFAEAIVAKYGLPPPTIFYPDWNRHGKAAGPIRNKLIAAECDVMIACVAEDRTGGTESAIAEAERLGKEPDRGQCEDCKETFFGEELHVEFNEPRLTVRCDKCREVYQGRLL